MTIKKKITCEMIAERFAGVMGAYRVEWDERKEDWIPIESITKECMRTGPFSQADGFNLPLIDPRYVEIFPDAIENIINLDSAISKTRVREPMMVYRGAKLEEFRGIETGKDVVYISPAFTSTTVSCEIAMKHAELTGSSLVGIRVPGGDGIGVFSEDHENMEFVLKRHAILKLIRYDPDSEGIKAIFEFIG